jgi:hypothetical protein
MKIFKKPAQIQGWHLVGLARESRLQKLLVHSKTQHEDCTLQFKAKKTFKKEKRRLRPLKDSFQG